LTGRTLGALARWQLARAGFASVFAAPLAGFAFGLLLARTLPNLEARVAAAAIALAGAALAVAVASSRLAMRKSRNLLLFSLPLYGRELARGLALGPCALGALFPLAACAGWSLASARAIAWPLPLEAATVATLIALSATLRDTWRVTLYRALACGSAALLCAASLVSDDGGASQAALALLAFALGFLALRAFGETLARYDPIAER
jgi:hypothetical protein